ncbi:hypothetical protein ACFSJU_00605 [Paradesertivirga mongoliensis]|uniref:Uncharacterized protein n=1 Tax=Paradesertivirga mongoliensis TaxID=2100740 RepID=A0ABW4ZG48_9SPHI|nr:hypothetical protein [Pedobacter mongoliensis]
MENEFWLDVELLSLGGCVSLMIIPRRKHFELLLDDQELGRVYKDKDENWQDMDATLPAYSIETIGIAIDEFLGTLRSFKIAG